MGFGLLICTYIPLLCDGGGNPRLWMSLRNASSFDCWNNPWLDAVMLDLVSSCVRYWFYAVDCEVLFYEESWERMNVYSGDHDDISENSTITTRTFVSLNISYYSYYSPSCPSSSPPRHSNRGLTPPHPKLSRLILSYSRVLQKPRAQFVAGYQKKNRLDI